MQVQIQTPVALQARALPSPKARKPVVWSPDLHTYTILIPHLYHTYTKARKPVADLHSFAAALPSVASGRRLGHHKRLGRVLRPPRTAPPVYFRGVTALVKAGRAQGQ